MKKWILFSTLNFLFVVATFAQNSVQLTINHKLGSEDFVMEMGSKNNLDHDFEITRLQYYIADIKLTHDGGMQTDIEDLWVLVNADEPTQVDLGMHNINSLERINFYIGVGPDENHLDPASYDPEHPLAPQFPSMHWGWAAGYRFVALEGNGGSAFNQLIQLHGLGDDNYFQAKIDMEATAVDNILAINLDADYTRALEDISLNSGVIVHGEVLEAKQCLENFRDYVFSPSSGSTNTLDLSVINNFQVYPNPTNTGHFSMLLEAKTDEVYSISITDVLGRQVMLISEVNINTVLDLELESEGLYFVNLIKAGQSVLSKKLIVR